MLICKVLRPLVSTNRIPGFEHKRLQVVLDGSSKKVAVDAVGSPWPWSCTLRQMVYAKAYWKRQTHCSADVQMMYALCQ